MMQATLITHQDRPIAYQYQVHRPLRGSICDKSRWRACHECTIASCYACCSDEQTGAVTGRPERAHVEHDGHDEGLPDGEQQRGHQRRCQRPHEAVLLAVPAQGAQQQARARAWQQCAMPGIHSSMPSLASGDAMRHAFPHLFMQTWLTSHGCPVLSMLPVTGRCACRVSRMLAAAERTTGSHHEVRRKESAPALPSGPPQMALEACDSVPKKAT